MMTNEIKRKIASLVKKGLSIYKISKLLSVSWGTVRKYAKFCALHAPKFRRHSFTHVEPYRAEIARFVAENSTLGKQRMTGKRMFDVLKQKHPNITFGLRTFQRFLKVNDFKAPSVASVPLEHEPGCAQIDFGAAKYYEHGVLHDGKYLVLSLPHSGMMFAVLLPSENRQCLVFAMMRIFNKLDGVPIRIRIDNASSMVNRGKRYKINDEFQSFADFFGFEIERCNPARGNEKGCVERAVSTVRQNFLSPPPHFNSLHVFNDDLLSKCETLNIGKRYGTNRSKKELFEEDKSALLPMPKDEFKPVTYTIRRTDKCALLEFDGHRYSAGSNHPNETMVIEAGLFCVQLFTETGNFVCRHERCYTEHDSIDLSSYEESFVECPRALRGSGLMSDEEASAIAKLSKSERRDVICKRFEEIFGVINFGSYRKEHEKYKDLFNDK